MKLGVLTIACVIALVGWPRPGGTEDRAKTSVNSVQSAERSDARLGVWQSFDEAVSWFRARASAGDASAQYELAHMQFVGLVPQGEAGETQRLLTAAAEAGNDQGELLLARVREFGFEGTPPDLLQALKWYTRAAATTATPDLRLAATEGCDRLRARLSASQIAQAETLATLRWSDVR